MYSPGTYPHIQQQPQQAVTPTRPFVAAGASASGVGAKNGAGALTQQEMQAAAVAAAEHGYYNREYYVDDGENYYGDDYGDHDDYSEQGYIGAEGMKGCADGMAGVMR